MSSRPRKTTLGQRIELLRDQKGWDNTTLAAKSDLPASTVSRVTTGRVSAPDLDTLYRLADALEASFDEFIGLALYDLLGKKVKISGVAPSAEELEAAIRAFPWLVNVVRDLATMSPNEQEGVLAYLHARKQVQDRNPQTN